MSNGFQCIGIVGGLGKDPEIRSTPNGKKVASFSVAVNEGFGNSAYVEWFNVIAWNELAEFVEKYLKKGKQVSVTGKFKTRSWDDCGLWPEEIPHGTDRRQDSVHGQRVAC